MSDETAKSGDSLDHLETLSLYISRAYYNYLGLLNRTLKTHGLDEIISAGMGHILFSLFKAEKCKVGDLVASTKLSYPTISSLLRRMEKSGLVKRKRDTKDNRVVWITLTAKAKEMEANCYKVMEDLETVLASGLAKKDIKSFKQMFNSMVTAIQSDEESAKKA